MSATDLINFVTPETLTSLLQDAGCRVTRSEQGGVVQLHTASQGIGFNVRFGNVAQEAGRYIDFDFNCVLQIQGELPEGLVNQWNATRRYGRLFVQGSLLVLQMDVLVADGVSQKYLLSNLVVWDRLLQEVVIYLRDFGRNAAAAKPEAVAS